VILSATRSGSGTPLILIHGMGSASTIWKGIAPALERLFEVITFDLPGHGKTPYDSGQAMDPASLADLVVANMDSLDIQKAHVVGNSLGGWVGLEIASRHPSRVLTFIGLAPAGLILTPYTKINPITAQSRQIAVFTHSIQKYLLRFMWAKRIGFASSSPKWRELPYEYALDAALAMGLSKGYFPAWNAMLYRRFDTPIDSSIPLTVVFGDSDHTLPASTWQERTLVPPHTRWIVLPQCGHAPQWDCPEDVVRIICETTAQR